MNCLYGKLNSETIKKEYKTSDTIEVDNLKNKLNVIKTPETLTIIKNSATGDSETFLFDGQNPVTIDLHEVDAYAGRENDTAKTIVDIENNTIEVEVKRTPGILYLMKGEEIVGTFDGNINTYITLPETDLSGIESSLQDLNGHIEETQSNVDTLQQELSSAQADIENIETDIDDIETRIEDISNSINTTNSTIQDLSGNINTISEDLSNTQTELSSTQATLSNVEQDVSILETEGDGTKYLADNGLYQTISGGIETLVGTVEKPINLYTDTEIGKLYSLKGYCYFRNTLTSPVNITIRNILFFRDAQTEGYILNGTLNAGGTGSWGAFPFTTRVDFGSYTDGRISALIGYSSIERFNDKNNFYSSGAVSFYAPTTGGTQGQILQSNGYAEPTWIDLIQPTVERLI